MYNTNINEISRWFTKNKRQMPWRDTKDPYKIWLSETMLQQTQVKTVIPYYKKWVSNYPTILDVASAEENSLLKAWEGLGYYRRCRNFHKASIIVTDSYNGRIPDNYDTFKSLPGVGDYTASAVMSIVFGLPYSVLDANVWRVMCRYLGIKNITVNNKNRIRTKIIFAAMLGGFFMGFGARLAFGCNIGALFSGIASGSLHGWIWFLFAFIGTYFGVKLRRLFYT